MFVRCLVRNSAGPQIILAKVFGGSLHSVHASSGIAPSRDHASFIPDPFQFIDHLMPSSLFYGTHWHSLAVAEEDLKKCEKQGALSQFRTKNVSLTHYTAPRTTLHRPRRWTGKLTVEHASCWASSSASCLRTLAALPYRRL